MSDVNMARQALNAAEKENVYAAVDTLYKTFSEWQKNRVVLCGFSPFAKKLTDTLLAQGFLPERMLIVDSEQNSPAFYKDIKICASAVLENSENKQTPDSEICNCKSTVFIICSNPYSGYYANILHNSGKSNVMTYQLLSVCDKRFDYPLERYNSGIATARTEHLLQNKEFYLRFLDDLADDESKDIMCKWILYHLTYSAEYCCVKAISPPYFGQTILQPAAYRFFADLGGYDGDTLRDFLSLDIDFDGYWYFEPDEDLYGEALKTSDEPRIKYNNLALGRSVGSSCFSKSSNMSTTGVLSENGGTEVRVDAIDNILASFADKFTAIKMDVEGGEADALYGAEHTISTHHPALILSVEHKPDDIKTLSEIVLNFYSGYKFYLRCCMDSLYTDLTMYAVDRGEL